MPYRLENQDLDVDGNCFAYIVYNVTKDNSIRYGWQSHDRRAKLRKIFSFIYPRIIRKVQ